MSKLSPTFIGRLEYLTREKAPTWILNAGIKAKETVILSEVPLVVCHACFVRVPTAWPALIITTQRKRRRFKKRVEAVVGVGKKQGQTSCQG
jgi:hypothetical protein